MALVNTIENILPGARPGTSAESSTAMPGPSRR